MTTLRWAALLLLGGVCGCVSAQAGAPAAVGGLSANQMIEQLKKPAQTRRMRNLTVESVVPVSPATATPVQPQVPVVVAAPPEPAPPASTPVVAPAAQAVAVPVAPIPASNAIPVSEHATLSLQIEFDYDSANIRTDSRQLLLLLVQALNSDQLQDAHFVVEGHTDAKGAAAYNQKLSLVRAQSVRDFLVKQGVSLLRLQVVGKGSSALANPRQPFAAENRRVQIVNLD
ncbi:MAG: OmpA family protein [Rhodoferax sp.]|nr:OmpA family protein [Rhodoferax sp.]